MRRAERAGFSTAWIPDSEFLFRDAWMALGAAAAATDRIRLATGVTNVKTRHPAVTAAALTTLDEATGGRCALGVGTGDTSVKALGWSPSRLDEIEQSFSLIRSLCRGDAVAFDRHVSTLIPASGRVPPLFLAATGPKTLQLAGRIADGVLIMAGVTTELITQAIRNVETGLREAGRSRDQIEICLGAVSYVADSEADVLRVAKPHCVGDAQRGAQGLLEQAGVHFDGEVPAVVPGVTPDMTHATDWAGAVEAAGRWLGDQAALRYAEAFTLIGTAPDLVDRIEAAQRAGVDSIYLRHYRSYVLPDDLIDTFASTVMVRLAEPLGPVAGVDPTDT